ncbi:MAG: hypothetical protein IPM92_11535 [Saprospiraceae bacterium]|nr:hypothetical protein [Saprospiraceae bacterium]
MKTHLILFFSILVLGCSDSPNKNEVSKEEVGQEQNDISNSSDKPTLDSNDPFMITTPEGFYEPTGLKKLNLIEMYKLGTGGSFKKDFPLKNQNGEPVDWSIMVNPEKTMFMQMYTNDKGEVVEGVVFEVTDEIKAMIIRVRMGTN